MLRSLAIEQLIAESGAGCATEETREAALEALEKDFERDTEPSSEEETPDEGPPSEDLGYADTIPPPDPLDEAFVDLEISWKTRNVDVFPKLDDVTTKKLPHRNLVLDGICSHCAHCGHQLSDAVSIQRGIGPVCSKKGYHEDAVEGDECQAMIDLSEFPELVDFLTEHYKPLGLRGLVNGLVKVASLNRPRGRGMGEGNYRVHAACCDAIESLGHRQLAGLLRETLVVATVTKCSAEPGVYSVHVKKRDLPTWWNTEMRRAIAGLQWVKADKTHRVRFYHSEHDGDADFQALSNHQGADGRRVTNRAVLWNLLKDAFTGMVVKTVDGNVRIKEKKAA